MALVRIPTLDGDDQLPASVQTKAITAAAADAAAKVTAHTNASDPHGDRAASAADATTKANTAQANAVQRANHTGTQPHTTITGLGDAAAKNTGTTSGTVAAGNHTHPGGGTGDMLAANNLSELPNVSAARTNLDLGNSAVRDVGTSSSTVAAGDAPAAVQAFAIQRANHLGTQSADTITETAGLKVLTAAERTKLAGIATGATVNASDSFLLGRANHTGVQAQATITGLETRLAQMDADIAAASGGTSTLTVAVTADGTTDAAPAIQSVLDALTSSSKSYKLVVQPATKGNSIYLNSKVRITTSNTEVSFAGPVLVGTGIDPDGFGGFSIIGSAGTTRAVSSGATRGSSQIVVASTTGITAKTLIKIYDNDTAGGQAAGQKAELAEVVDINGTTLYLDHPLHHTYTGTITLAPINAVTRSGFSGLNATFTGQQAAGFLFVCKMQYTRLCYFRDMHFRGDPANSWSRECYSMRDSYRPLADNCTASFSWNYTVGSTYDYAFTADMSTGCIWRSCRVSNTRHAFSADKGSAGLIYADCVSDNTTASGFDLHGGWTRDIVYSHCVATASDGRNSADNTKAGFLAGNTTYKAGAQWITYIGCIAQGFQAYTSTAGAAGAGEGVGFGVVDGCSDITYLACRVIDSMFGFWALSLVGTPIRNVTIQGCVLDGIAVGANAAAGAAALPIWVNAGVAPNDVDGFYVRNNEFVNCAGQAAARIWGNSGNTLANVIVEGNTWTGPGVTGVFPLDVRYVDDPLIQRNTFFKTRRGVSLTGSPNAAVLDNTFVKLADGATASMTFLDSGGANTNLLVTGNKLVGYTPTAVGTAPSSSGASVELMTAQRRYTTAGRPSAAVVGAGAQYFDTTLGKPGWSDGTAWKDAAGTTI